MTGWIGPFGNPNGHETTQLLAATRGVMSILHVAFVTAVRGALVAFRLRDALCASRRHHVAPLVCAPLEAEERRSLGNRAALSTEGGAIRHLDGALWTEHGGSFP
jgi:hypothetical protein